MSSATVLFTFFDNAEGVYRHKGERFEATAQRVAEINAAAEAQGFGPFVEAHKPARKQPPAPEGE